MRWGGHGVVSSWGLGVSARRRLSSRWPVYGPHRAASSALSCYVCHVRQVCDPTVPQTHARELFKSSACTFVLKKL